MSKAAICVKKDLDTLRTRRPASVSGQATGTLLQQNAEDLRRESVLLSKSSSIVNTRKAYTRFYCESCGSSRRIY